MLSRRRLGYLLTKCQNIDPYSMLKYHDSCGGLKVPELTIAQLVERETVIG
jgi:hypothetical protein